MTTTLDHPPTSTPETKPVAAHGSQIALTPRFVAAWRSEWAKLSSVRSPRVIAALTVVVGGFAAFAVARFVTDEEITVTNVFGFSAVFTAVFAAVSGILLYTTEAEFKTAQHTFAAEPRRGIVVLAKTAAAAGFTALLGLSGLAAGAVGAVLGGVEAGDTLNLPGFHAGVLV